MELRPAASYAKAIRPTLPEHVFAPATSRILWLPFHVGVISTLAWTMVTGRLPAALWPVASIVIGICLSGLVFLGHETMHGAVVRGRTAIKLIGFISLAPFTLSPTLWTAWHNRVHHNHCAHAGIDPDMYPTMIEYETQRGARIMADHFGLGRRRLVSLLSLAFGFTGQSQQMLWGAQKRHILTPGLHRRAILEFFLGVALWATVAVIVGFVPFLFVYVLPFVVANTIVMAFIMSNHNLNPLTEINDPLVNSLSVTLPRPLEFLTLDFGYHVEHHLFPTVSARHGKIVRAAILAHCPERYQAMPLTSALAQLYRTARVYKDDVTLTDPNTGETWPTLLPRDPASS
jgi:fatty acid desaturase